MNSARVESASTGDRAPATGSGSESQPAATTADPAARLPISTILSFCSPTIGVGFMYFLVALYMTPFATDVLVISPAAIGTIFFISRIWDAVSDPIAGFLSDRTRSRIGRRRPWIAASIIPVCGVYVIAWSPPQGMEGQALVAWIAVGVIGFYTAMTIFIVPHTALGAELTDSYHDRTRIFGFRHVIWSLGSIAAVIAMQMLINSDDARTLARQSSFVVAAVTVVLLLITAITIRERSEFQGRGATNPLHSLRDVLSNRHARLLLIIYSIESLGGAAITVLTYYVATYVVMRPDLTALFILSYMVASVCFVGLWLPLSRRFGKKRLWIASMLLTACAFGGMFFLSEGRIILFAVLAALGGTAAGCGAIVGPSIQADVIDYDEYKTGQRKEGAYFAAWNFVYKSATGFMMISTLWVLEVAGFIPNAEQSEGVKLAVISLYSLLPLSCYLIGAFLLRRFSLDEVEHSRIRVILDERTASAVE